MIVIKSTKLVAVDIDDTIAAWCPSQKQIDSKGVKFTYLTNGKKKSDYIVPNDNLIEEIKRHKLRGHTIVFWSAGGWEWAARAAKVLKIQDYVDVAMSKPDWIMDDKNPEEFMPKPKWKPFE